MFLLSAFQLPLKSQAETITFVHPGLFINSQDILRMKVKVSANEEPWLGSYTKLINDSYTKNRKPRGPYKNVVNNQQGIKDTTGLYPLRYDANIAYQSALVWAVTGNQTYADDAIKILDNWSGTLESITGSDAQLTAAQEGFRMANAAEILRYTNAGWANDKIINFENMLKNVFVPLIKNYGAANWGTGCLKAMLGIGIFCNDSDIYNSAINAFYNNPDCGLTNIINEFGQNRESGRDQVHSQILIAHLAEFAKCAENQGLNVFSASNNRLLTAYEYMAKYMLFNNVPYDKTFVSLNYNSTNTISQTNRGELYPIYEIIYSHYVKKMGLPAPYTKMALVFTRPEGKTYEGATDSHLLGYHSLITAIDSIPAKVQDLTGELVNSAVALSWTMDDNVSGYNIYKTENQSLLGSYNKINEHLITGNTFTDNKTLSGKKYYYKITKVKNIEESETSKAFSITIPSIAPKLPPSNITAKLVINKAILLDWQPAPLATGYNIYRYNGDTYNKINKELITQTKGYHLGIEPDKIYKYVITSVNEYGESDFSFEDVSITTPQNIQTDQNENVLNYPRVIRIPISADCRVNKDNSCDFTENVVNADSSNMGYFKLDLTNIETYLGDKITNSSLFLTRGGNYSSFGIDFLESNSVDYDNWYETLGSDGYTTFDYNKGNLVYNPPNGLTEIGIFDKFSYGGSTGTGIDITALTKQEFSGDKQMTFRFKRADSGPGAGFVSINSLIPSERPYINLIIDNDDLKEIDYGRVTAYNSDGATEIEDGLLNATDKIILKRTVSLNGLTIKEMPKMFLSVYTNKILTNFSIIEPILDNDEINYYTYINLEGSDKKKITIKSFFWDDINRMVPLDNAFTLGP